MRTGVLILSLSLLAGGCVSKKKYDELADALGREQAAHATDVAERDETIKGQEVKIETLEEALARSFAVVPEADGLAWLLQPPNP